jgi:hypothetical protein
MSKRTIMLVLPEKIKISVDFWGSCEGLAREAKRE